MAQRERSFVCRELNQYPAESLCKLHGLPGRGSPVQLLGSLNPCCCWSRECPSAAGQLFSTLEKSQESPRSDPQLDDSLVLGSPVGKATFPTLPDGFMQQCCPSGMVEWVLPFLVGLLCPLCHPLAPESCCSILSPWQGQSPFPHLQTSRPTSGQPPHTDRPWDFLAPQVFSRLLPPLIRAWLSKACWPPRVPLH